MYNKTDRIVQLLVTILPDYFRGLDKNRVNESLEYITKLFELSKHKKWIDFCIIKDGLKCIKYLDITKTEVLKNNGQEIFKLDDNEVTLDDIHDSLCAARNRIVLTSFSGKKYKALITNEFIVQHTFSKMTNTINWNTLAKCWNKKDDTKLGTFINTDNINDWLNTSTRYAIFYMMYLNEQFTGNIKVILNACVNFTRRYFNDNFYTLTDYLEIDERKPNKILIDLVTDKNLNDLFMGYLLCVKTKAISFDKEGNPYWVSYRDALDALVNCYNEYLKENIK